MLIHFYTFMTALFASLVMVPFLRRWALEQNNVDQPDGARKQHTVAMPRLGGISIFLSFLFSVIVYAPIDNFVRGMLAGGLVIFATGLIDDLSGLSAKRKFSGQIVACLATIVVGKVYLVDLGDLFGFGAIVLPPWLGIPFTVFAVVGVVNAINLVDGLDGLAGGISVIALSSFLVLGLLENDAGISLLAAALVGGILGFLKYNFYPARIFMGDAGSMTVGFFLGFMAIGLTQSGNASISPVAPVLILGLPLIDTVWVMCRRVVKGESPFAPDRSHMHHKLLNLGFEHRFTVLIMYGISVFWSVFAVFFRSWPDYVLLFSYLMICCVGYQLLRYFIHHPKFLARFMRDADESLRHTVIYTKMAVFANTLFWPLKFLLAGYALLVVISVVNHNSTQWQVSLLLLVVSVGLRLWSHEGGGQFVMLVVYAACGIAAYEVWHVASSLIFGFSIKLLGDVLLALMALLAGFKMVFRTNNEYFLSTVDFLVLSVCAFLAVASQTGALGVNLYGPLFRCVLLLFVVRTTIVGNVRDRQVLRDAVMVFLLLVTLVALLG